MYLHRRSHGIRIFLVALLCFKLIGCGAAKPLESTGNKNQMLQEEDQSQKKNSYLPDNQAYQPPASGTTNKDTSKLDPAWTPTKKQESPLRIKVNKIIADCGPTLQSNSGLVNQHAPGCLPAFSALTSLPDSGLIVGLQSAMQACGSIINAYKTYLPVCVQDLQTLSSN